MNFYYKIIFSIFLKLSFIGLIFPNSENEIDLELEKIKHQSISDSVYINKIITNFQHIDSIPRIDKKDIIISKYRSDLDEYYKEKKNIDYKFYNPSTNKYYWYFSTSLGSTILIDEMNPDSYDSGYNFGAHITLPKIINLFNFKVIPGIEFHAISIPTLESFDYRIQSAFSTFTTKLFYKFYLKSELGISVAYYNTNSGILPSFKNSIYFEVNLEKYSPFNIAFSSGIQGSIGNPNQASNNLILSDFKIYFCRKFEVEGD